MHRGHELVYQSVGTPEQVSTIASWNQFGAFQAMIAVLHRLEKQKWDVENKGFDFVLLDLNPHSTFFNIMAMTAYGDFLSSGWLPTYHR